MLLRKPKAPALPYAPPVYLPSHQDALASMLRTYFNQLDTATTALLGVNGGQHLSVPHGAFSSRVAQTTTANTPTIVTFSQTDYASGLSYVSGDGVHVSQNGVYNYQFSLQLANTDTQIHEVTVWLRKNGTDFPYSASSYAVTASHGGIPGYLIAVCNFFIDLNAGDSIELVWAATSSLVTIHYAGPSTSPFAHPGIPSAVATLSFVSST